MSLKIIELMQPGQKRGLPWLQKALQAALELELATLPPYLCGLWSLQDQASGVAQRIHSVVFDEMAHFGLACNMLRATGVQPQIFTGYDEIHYPGQLPGGVRPKCDPDFFPCDDHFEVKLGFDNFRSFAKMCMQIEYPEDPVPRLLLAEEETFTSIGKFYDAIRDAFNSNKFAYQTMKQLQARRPEVFIIDGLPNALKAIDTIQKQGEGSPRSPFSAPGQLAHFYAFGEIYFGHKYVFDPVRKAGCWTGDPITPSDVFPMTPVPAGGYLNPPTEVTQCDKDFTDLLQKLDDAWSNGEPGDLDNAIDLMGTLARHANQLLQKKLPRPDGHGIYGPQFRKFQPKPGQTL